MMQQQQFGQQSYQNSNHQSRVQAEELNTVSEDSISRVRYLRKMYFLLFLQLLFATYMTLQVNDIPSGFGPWVEDNSGFTFWTALVICLVIQLVVLFSRKSISKSPVNVVFYVIHMIAFGFVFAYWEQVRAGDTYIGYGLQYFTVVIFSLLIHVIFAKNEIKFQSVALYILGAVYFVTLLFEIFVAITPIALYILAVLTILWGFYIVWENETIVGAKNEWSRDDYFTGAIGVYMYIFLLILKMVDLIKQVIIKARA